MMVKTPESLLNSEELREEQRMMLAHNNEEGGPDHQMGESSSRIHQSNK